MKGIGLGIRAQGGREDLSDMTFRYFHIRLQLHGAIFCPDSFVLMLRYYANLKAIGYESTSLNRIVADKSHRVIVALGIFLPH